MSDGSGMRVRELSFTLSVLGNAARSQGARVGSLVLAPPSHAPAPPAPRDPSTASPSARGHGQARVQQRELRIDTPAVFPTTRRGHVQHLTPDNTRRLAPPGLHLSLDHLCVPSMLKLNRELAAHVNFVDARAGWTCHHRRSRRRRTACTDTCACTRATEPGRKTMSRLRS